MTNMRHRIASTSLALHLAGAITSLVAAMERVPVDFQFDYATQPGQSLYVLGDLPELGSGNAANSIKMEPSLFPTWRVTIALPRGESYTYRYAWRNDAVSQWSSAANFNAVSGVLQGSTPPRIDPLPHKGLLYHSGWSSPRVFWRTSDAGTWVETPMIPFGPGRNQGESRWRAILPGAGGAQLQFYFTDGAAGRDPFIGLYLTKLDGCFVQDGQLFNYVPPAVVGPQQQFNVSPGIPSVQLGENRPYRVLLPRGYQQNTQRRYPVLYLHDGQNVFDQGPFGSWNADETASSLTRSAQMQETIIVGVDNTANRARDYIPPDDIVPIGPGTGQPGRANLYAAFLASELKPVIDASYRTLPDRAHTATLGSSLGGVVSLYLGWDHADVVSKIGAMSGSWQLPNFPARVALGPARDLRIYIDSGTAGTSSDNAWPTMNLRDDLLQLGYVLEGDLRHRVGYGHQHNEAAWAARLPMAYDFLFPILEQENELVPLIFAGDLNCDGAVTVADIAGFVQALTDPSAYAVSFPECDPLYADINHDNAVSVTDIGPFVALLTGAS